MKLGLIAGTGDLPRQIAENQRNAGTPVHVIAIKGFEEPWISDFSHEVCGIAEIGRAIKSLKKAGCDTLSFIGNIKRPDFVNLKPDLKGMSVLPKIVSAARKGDEALLRSIVGIFEEDGFTVVGAHELMSGLSRGAEVIVGRDGLHQLGADIEKAFRIAGEMGKLDIGQGCVVCNGLVLAVEAQEGTDEMLKRVFRLPSEIRGDENARAGVLVKRPKPIQENRIDLPTIGPSTVRLASEAGLSAVCGVANGALWVEHAETARLAEALGVALVSLTEEGKLP